MFTVTSRRSSIPRRLLVALFVVLLAAAVVPTRTRADGGTVIGTTCAPGEVIQFFNDQPYCVGPAGVDIAPDHLLNRSTLNSVGIYGATTAQQQALATLENQAVAATAANHAVPTTELGAVRSWGRADALAELWGLLVRAAKTPASSRTPDQQLAVDWMSAMARRSSIQEAISAGREMTKYVGKSIAGYDALFANGRLPSREDIEAYLDDQPVNFNNADETLATGGYCVYRSPAPYGSEYKGYLDQTCFTPCTNVLGCDDPLPTAEEFIKWGSAAYAYSSYSNQEFANTAKQVALGVGLGGIVGSVVVGVTVATALSGVLAGTTFATALFPTLATAATYSAYAGATAAGASAAADAAAGVAAASVVGVVAAAVILFVTGTTARLITLLTDAEVPGKVAQAIVDARTAGIDVGSMINGDDASTLFALFVGASLPAPRVEFCNNSRLLTALTPTKLCLNPPVIPAATSQDPQFVVTDHGLPTSPAAAMYASPAISYRSFGGAGQFFGTARLHGTWFVHTINGATIQSLRIRYVDWDTRFQTAWLMQKDSGAYVFVGIPDTLCSTDTCSGPQINASTCLASGICWVSDTIKYFGNDGYFHTARALGPTNVTWPTPAHITYGAALTATQLNATAGVPGWFAYTADVQSVSASSGLILTPGSHTLRVAFTPDDLTFALPGTENVTLTVDPVPLTVRAQGATMTYGEEPPIIGADYETFVGNDGPDGFTELPDCFAQATDHSAVGIYDTVCTGGISPFYDFQYEKGSIEVFSRGLGVRASSPTIIAGQTVPAIIPIYGNFAGGDGESVLTARATCSATVTGTPPAGTYPTSCQGAAAPNYTPHYEPGTLTVQRKALMALGPAHLWFTLLNSDDVGTRFDVRVELVKNDSGVLATGLARCVTGIGRSAASAKEVVVEWAAFDPADLVTGDELSLRVSTRIGTLANDTKCAGHGAAAGLRLYYDSGDRASRFDQTVSPWSNATEYLHSDGTACGSGPSKNVSNRTLDSTAPTGTSPRCADFAGTSFNGGNLWRFLPSFKESAVP